MDSCYQKVKKEGHSEASAARICQASTGQTLATGKPPKKSLAKDIKSIRRKYRVKATTQDEWIVTDGMGEYVEYYNPTGHVIVFTKNRADARRTVDDREAGEIARIARVVYNRRQMRIQLADRR